MTRKMGLDVGIKRIGIALSDPMGWTAQGHSVLNRKNLQDDLQEIARLCLLMEVDEIVVGMPRNMNGTYGTKAEEIEEFAGNLAEVIDLPIVFWDERLTTRAAERTLLEANVSRKKRREVIDKIAAVNILQGYLNRQNSGK
ncbi:MAG: Holliday junction resolvase RuvX [Syntrophomonadaceae bacterium]|nr:Holliday junction resolvase RuvX [Syntrophomonadaceae bacterium]